MKPNPTFASILAAMVALSAAAHAAITVDSSSFNGVTNGAISTGGTADWGYLSAGGVFGASPNYNNTDFGSVANGAGTVITTVSGTSTIGSVTLTEGTSGNETVSPQTNTSNFTFDGSTAFGSYGNFAPSEADIWQMTFNDLGVGQFTITLYMGHSEDNRIFDVDVTGSGITPFTTTSAQIGTLGSTVAAYNTNGSAFTYDIDVTTTAASDDLTLTFGGVSGGFGGAILAGYTVTAIPEPSSSALIGLGTLALIRRRRN